MTRGQEGGGSVNAYVLLIQQEQIAASDTALCSQTAEEVKESFDLFDRAGSGKIALFDRIPACPSARVAIRFGANFARRRFILRRIAWRYRWAGTKQSDPTPPARRQGEPRGLRDRGAGVWPQPDEGRARRGQGGPGPPPRSRAPAPRRPGAPAPPRPRAPASATCNLRRPCDWRACAISNCILCKRRLSRGVTRGPCLATAAAG